MRKFNLATKKLYKDFNVMTELESLVMCRIKNPYQQSSYWNEIRGIENTPEEEDLWGPVTKNQKNNIYALLQEGFYHETSEQKDYHLNPGRSYSKLNSPEETATEKAFSKTPFYHDLLTAIRNYFEAIKVKNLNAANKECSNAFKLYINHIISDSPGQVTEEFLAKVSRTISGTLKSSSNIELDTIKDYYFECMENYINEKNIKENNVDVFIDFFDQTFFKIENLKILEEKIKNKLKERYEEAARTYQISEKQYEKIVFIDENGQPRPSKYSKNLWIDERSVKKDSQLAVNEHWSHFQETKKRAREYHNRLKEKMVFLHNEYLNFELKISDGIDTKAVRNAQLDVRTIFFSKTRVITSERKKWLTEHSRKYIYEKIKAIINQNNKRSYLKPLNE